MDHVTTTSSTSTTLCAFVILAALLAAIVLLIVHLLPTGVNPLDEAISDYGVGKYKNFYRLATFWLGAAGLLLAVALAKAVFPKPTLAILALLVFAAVRWSITIFPTDLPGEEETSTGHSHVALAGIAFAAISIAAVMFPATIDDDPYWHNELTLLYVLAGAVVTAAIATGITFRLKRYFGLAERLLYAAMIAWLIAVATVLAVG